MGWAVYAHMTEDRQLQLAVGLMATGLASIPSSSAPTGSHRLHRLFVPRHLRYGCLSRRRLDCCDGWLLLRWCSRPRAECVLRSRVVVVVAVAVEVVVVVVACGRCCWSVRLHAHRMRGGASCYRSMTMVVRAVCARVAVARGCNGADGFWVGELS